MGALDGDLREGLPLVAAPSEGTTGVRCGAALNMIRCWAIIHTFVVSQYITTPVGNENEKNISMTGMIRPSIWVCCACGPVAVEAAIICLCW